MVVEQQNLICIIKRRRAYSQVILYKDTVKEIYRHEVERTFHIFTL